MARKPKPVRDALVYVVVRLLYGGCAWLPEWIVYPALAGLGRGYLALAPRRRRIAFDNLRQAFGAAKSDRELRTLARRSCGNAFLVAADMARTARYLRSGVFSRRIDRRAWDAAVARVRELVGDKPPVMCTPHLGSWEVASIVGSQQYQAMHIIARPIANPWLQAFIKRLRSPTGQHIHPRRGGIRHLLAALRAGYAVGTLPDQNQRLRGIFVPVFGRLASCDRSQARLAQLAGCPILVGAAVRSGRGFRFRIAVSDVFTVPAAAGPESDPIWDGTHRLQQAVEKLILEAPEQYFWVHNRYRTRPPAEKAAANGEVAQASAS